LQGQQDNVKQKVRVEVGPRMGSDKLVAQMQHLGTRQSVVEEPQATIAGPALLIALGNGLSRLLGLAREMVTADLFGATGLVSAYRVATIVPTMLHDLLVGGMVSSALVPVFSEYTERDRAELWRMASLVISLTLFALGMLTLVAESLAPQIAWLLGGGFPSPLLTETTRLIRITIPAVIFLGLSSVLSALLYAQRRFALPAFTTATFNAALVLITLLTAARWGIRGMAMGLLGGAILQVVLQVPGLRPMRFVPSLDLRDPGLRRLLRLSLPVFGGLVVSQIAVGIDRHLASIASEQAIAWMQLATTLIQFPLGLVAAAVSMAVLPSLSRCAIGLRDARSSSEDRARSAFRSTLGRALRLVLLLILPNAVGLFLLAEPVVRLLFQHGDFSPLDTIQTARALRVYLIALTFAAIDQPLIFAFYAQQDTTTPAVVGVVGVGIYLAVALQLLQPLGMIGLVLANSIQWIGHTLIMLWLLQRRMGGLTEQGLWNTGIQALLSALVMIIPVVGARWQMELLGGARTLLGQLLTVAVSAGLGALFYVGGLAAFGVEEWRQAWRWLTATRPILAEPTDHVRTAGSDQ
jgi:putative peptidoglycan lipid II flippase